MSNTTRTCATQLCDNPLDTKGARGYCHTCYQRLRRQGSFNISPVLSAADRLARGLVEQPDGCLEWTKGTQGGYGSIRVDGENVRTHRLAWELANGLIPDDLWVLHHCDNPPCCQTDPTDGFPDGHLFLGTHGDNMRDMASKGRMLGQQSTHCPQGHPYNEANTYLEHGRRHCRECRQSRDVGKYQAALLNPRPVKVRKSHCSKGHELSGDNLYIAPNGGRHCRECKAARYLPRGPRPLKTHCVRGHAFDDANTAINLGKRVCRACGRVRYAQHKQQLLIARATKAVDQMNDQITDI